MQLLLNVLISNVCLPEEEKVKDGKECECASPLNPLAIAAVHGGEACESKGRCNNAG